MPPLKRTYACWSPRENKTGLASWKGFRGIRIRNEMSRGASNHGFRRYRLYRGTSGETALRKPLVRTDVLGILMYSDYDVPRTEQMIVMRRNVASVFVTWQILGKYKGPVLRDEDIDS